MQQALNSPPQPISAATAVKATVRPSVWKAWTQSNPEFMASLDDAFDAGKDAVRAEALAECSSHGATTGEVMTHLRTRRPLSPRHVRPRVPPRVILHTRTRTIMCPGIIRKQPLPVPRPMRSPSTTSDPERRAHLEAEARNVGGSGSWHPNQRFTLPDPRTIPRNSFSFCMIWDHVMTSINQLMHPPLNVLL